MTLKSCPFCGGDVPLNDEAPFPLIGNTWIIICPECYCQSPLAANASSAITAWNRRTPDWEQRYGELVETVAKRTDQAKGAK